MLLVLMKILSHAYAKKKTKRPKGFQISRLYWPFSSDIMAVKGLIFCVFAYLPECLSVHVCVCFCVTADMAMQMSVIVSLSLQT